MQILVEVQSERAESYVGKKGQVNVVRLSCMDRCPSGARLINTFDYELSDEEKLQYAGKVTDKKLKLNVTDLVPFGGRLRARGKIVEVVKNGA
jgi:hypothetical protein